MDDGPHLTELQWAAIPPALLSALRSSTTIPAGGRWFHLNVGDGTARELYAYSWAKDRFVLWDKNCEALGLYSYYMVQPAVAALFAEEDPHDRR